MSFSWLEYHSFAQELISCKELKVAEETKYRVIIGRVYYSMFGLLRDYIDIEGYTLPKSAEAHYELIKYLKQIGRNLNNREFNKVSEKLNRLREDRRKVDYDKEVASVDKLAEKSLIESNYIIEFLRPYGIL